MKFLIVTPRLLYPPDSGGKIRSARLFEQLAREHDITVVCFRKPAETQEQVDAMQACCSRIETIPWRETEKWTPRFFLELTANLASRYNYTVAKYHDRRMERLVGNILRAEEFDILICDFLQLSLNVLNIDFRPRVLFQHNVESMVRKRHYQHSWNPLIRMYLFIEWYKLWRFERYATRTFDHSIMVSDEDRRVVAAEYGVQNTSAIPTAVDADYFVSRNGPIPGYHLVFTGAMDWLPNEDGVVWFVDAVMPLIRRELDATLWIVGRNPSDTVRRLGRLHPDVEVTGTVDDIRPYIDRATLYVVPLRIGGGTRIKIYEAMAMGKAVVSTSVGAEGLPVVDGEHITLADDPADFAREVVAMLRSPERRVGMGTRACQYVRTHASWGAAAGRFAEICERVVAETSRNRGGGQDS